MLKGHEDLRQDERVMQLFGLVNSLLLANTDTCRRNLTYVDIIAIYIYNVFRHHCHICITYGDIFAIY